MVATQSRQRTAARKWWASRSPSPVTRHSTYRSAMFQERAFRWLKQPYWCNDMLFNRLIKDRRGVAAFEFTIIAGTLITLLVATFDFALVATQQIAMQGAIKSAGAYLQYYPSDTTGAASKIYNALPSSLQSQLNPADPTQVSFQCYCGGSTT